MYTDDPIIGVVGAQRAICALHAWSTLTNNANLSMAILEKRTLEVWARLLGALLFASLGVVVILTLNLYVTRYVSCHAIIPCNVIWNRV
eukprot:6210649-Pleurochrysis_carterae.AAC.1